MLCNLLLAAIYYILVFLCFRTHTCSHACMIYWKLVHRNIKLNRMWTRGTPNHIVLAFCGSEIGKKYGTRDGMEGVMENRGGGRGKEGLMKGIHVHICRNAGQD